MPKGTVVCDDCNWETDGELPVPGKVNYASYRGNGDNGLDETLTAKITEHHLDTGTVKTIIGNIGGHRYFKVFIDGATGDIEASSYAVVLRYSKER